MPQQDKDRTVAAVDLGSNSFHMMVAKLSQDRLHQIDRLREKVRLAAGLDFDRVLSVESQARALACLERFGERLRGMPTESVRVVGTNTLRKARNAHTFVREAQRVLGHPIEIISGLEEARLIYLGVAHSLAMESEHRLVVDIGGGSTECIVGQGFQVLETASLAMGCVSWSMQYFPNGKITNERFKRALVAARLRMQNMEDRLRERGWQQAVGSSGTIRATATILEANRWEEHGITLAGLRRIRETLVEARELDRLQLNGLSQDRREVYAGGLAVLTAVFESLGIEHMSVSKGALREGLLNDLVGRIQHHDVRDRTIQSFGERFHIDPEQSRRVAETALALLDQVTQDWELPPEVARTFLAWAAHLHEIGMSLSYVGFHKHGAYLIQNSHMPGFSREDQELLAAIVRSQRGSFSPDRFQAVRSTLIPMAMRLCSLLRLSICLNRTRDTRRETPEIRLEAREDELILHTAAGWLEDHALIKEDLQRQQEHFLAAGIPLQLTGATSKRVDHIV